MLLFWRSLRHRSQSVEREEIKKRGPTGSSRANRTVLGMLVLTSTETHARLESSPTSTVVLSYTSNKNVTGSILLSRSRADWKRTSIAVRFGIVGGEGGSLLVCFVRFNSEAISRGKPLDSDVLLLPTASGIKGIAQVLEL